MPETTRAAIARANAGNKYLLGKKFSENSRRIISEKAKNMWASPQFHAHMSKMQKAAWDNPARRKKTATRMAAQMLGNTYTLGRKQSADHIAKRTAAMRETLRLRKLTEKKEK